MLEPRPTFVPSGILIHPTVWSQYSNVTDRTGQTDRLTDRRKKLIVYPMHWIDPLISFFRLSVCLSVCVSVNRSVLDRLRPQFFTDFHKNLHAAQKCGRFVAYCLRDKPEVVCRYLMCADSDFDKLQVQVTTFFNSSVPNPIYTDIIQQCRLCIQW